MARVKFYTTVKSKATDSSVIPVVDGRFLIITDTHQLTYDFGSTRITLGDIEELNTEAERTALLTPLDKFYYVKDTGVLWRYRNNAWQSWADGSSVSSHVAATILSSEGVHGLRYNETDHVLQYKDGEGNWQTIQLASSSLVTTTLLAANWAAGRQSVTVNGITADTNGIASLTQSVTTAQFEAAAAASLIVCGQSANTLVIAAMGDVPTVDIPIAIIIFG